MTSPLPLRIWVELSDHPAGELPTYHGLDGVWKEELANFLRAEERAHSDGGQVVADICDTLNCCITVSATMSSHPKEIRSEINRSLSHRKSYFNPYSGQNEKC